MLDSQRRIEELEKLVRALAERLVAVSEVLANLVNKRREK